MLKYLSKQASNHIVMARNVRDYYTALDNRWELFTDNLRQAFKYIEQARRICTSNGADADAFNKLYVMAQKEYRRGL